MNRLFKPRRESEARKPLDSSATRAGKRSAGSGLRKALVAVGFAGLAYLAARRVRTSENAPSMDEVKETVGGIRSGEGFEIPIGESEERASDESETAEGDGDREAGDEMDTNETDTEGTGTTAGAIGNEPMPGEELSSEAVEERTEEDAHEEPKEPGEMTVDEELAEDIVDTEAAEDEMGTSDAETEEGEAEAEADERAGEENEDEESV